jgi:hypothetical protein
MEILGPTLSIFFAGCTHKLIHVARACTQHCRGECTSSDCEHMRCGADLAKDIRTQLTQSSFPWLWFLSCISHWHGDTASNSKCRQVSWQRMKSTRASRSTLCVPRSWSTRISWAMPSMVRTANMRWACGRRSRAIPGLVYGRSSCASPSWVSLD